MKMNIEGKRQKTEKWVLRFELQGYSLCVNL